MEKKKQNELCRPFEISKSKTKALASLNALLESDKTVLEEYERLQAFTKENIAGDMDTAATDDNRAKNRWMAVRLLCVLGCINILDTKTSCPMTGER